MLKLGGVNLDKKNSTYQAFRFFDFIKLEKDCLMTFTDSGTVQEESSILKKPCLIIREYMKDQKL